MYIKVLNKHVCFTAELLEGSLRWLFELFDERLDVPALPLYLQTFLWRSNFDIFFFKPSLSQT